MTEDSSPRNSRVNTRGRPFQRGNPGRPKGARDKATVMLETMFDGAAEEIGGKAVDLAREGQVQAIKLVLDRACPARKNRTVQGLTLPPIKTPADAVAVMGAIASAIADGVVTIAEARDLSDIIDAYRKAHEFADLERRIAALEREAAHGPVTPG